MTHRGPFQPLPFHDSVNSDGKWQQSDYGKSQQGLCFEMTGGHKEPRSFLIR